MKYIKEKLNKQDKIQNLIAVSDGGFLFMLHVYGCVFCSISLFCVYMCVHMHSSPRSMAAVPSGPGWELPGFPITAHHL